MELADNFSKSAKSETLWKRCLQFWRCHKRTKRRTDRRAEFNTCSAGISLNKVWWTVTFYIWICCQLLPVRYAKEKKISVLWVVPPCSVVYVYIAITTPSNNKTIRVHMIDSNNQIPEQSIGQRTYLLRRKQSTRRRGVQMVPLSSWLSDQKQRTDGEARL